MRDVMIDQTTSLPRGGRALFAGYVILTNAKRACGVLAGLCFVMLASCETPLEDRAWDVTMFVRQEDGSDIRILKRHDVTMEAALNVAAWWAWPARQKAAGRLQPPSPPSTWPPPEERSHQPKGCLQERTGHDWQLGTVPICRPVTIAVRENGHLVAQLQGPLSNSQLLVTMADLHGHLVASCRYHLNFEWGCPGYGRTPGDVAWCWQRDEALPAGCAGSVPEKELIKGVTAASLPARDDFAEQGKE
ncbi:hypothetical protein E3E12_02135 [Formicincola oecophyllae]|uniref:Uncharacterized protein n=1 Tax=Formicincola oecophyllae TaxID=2558361 RepID=A0A4Y6U726_9PROT|nr:hypothetical protein [Formicincola oecophyllae]QDH13193.2 hypothetical protein E3E12_02135 [Formicincola oecophyllae]